MINSIDGEKAFDKIQHSFMIKKKKRKRKTLSKLGISENFPKLIMEIHAKPTANIILNGERLHCYHLKLVTKQKCPFSLLLFNIILGRGKS